MSQYFRNRAEAGRLLAAELARLQLVDPVVLALPRGGVPVAAEVARVLHAPLDLLMVRKIGAPQQPELAVAAVVEGEQPEIVIDDETLLMTGASRAYVADEAKRQLKEIERRREVYLGAAVRERIAGRTAVVVDDGMATGTTVRAALKALARMKPLRRVLAVPVAPASVVAALRGEVDDLVCLSQPTFFHAVGAHYADFRQVEDDEVVALLRDARAAHER
jgi:putative phosphoribosyl transferase